MRNEPLRQIMLPELSGGLNTRDPENGIADNQSPDMLNLWFRDMALCKRPGQMLLAQLPGVTRISEPYNGGCAVIADGGLYRWDNAVPARYLSEYREGYAFEEGDYFVVSAPVTIDGTDFAAGDCAVYGRSAFIGQAVETTVLVKAGGVADGDAAEVTVTSQGQETVLEVALTAGDSPAQVAERICAAINADETLAAQLAADSHGAVVRLVQRYPQVWDDTLAVAIENGGEDPDTGVQTSPESADAPFWYNALTDVDARYRAGMFDPAAGYPLTAEAGAYYSASADGTVGGITYKSGDRAVFSRNMASLTLADSVAAGVTSLSVMVTATDIPGSPLSLEAAVTAGESAADVAVKVRATLADSEALSAVYAAGGEGTEVTLTQKAEGTVALDASLGFTVAYGTVTAVSANRPQWRRVGQLGREPGVFCEFGDTLYYIGGGEVWQIGADYAYRPVTPYVPAVLLNTRPDLSESDDGEPYNLIGSGFTVKYNGNAGGDVYYFVTNVPDADTFKIGDPAEGNAIVYTQTGYDFRVKMRGFSWLEGSASVVEDIDPDSTEINSIRLEGHGLMPGDMVLFTKSDGGPLPLELKEHDSDKVTVYQLPQTELDDTPVSVTLSIDVEPYIKTLTEGVEFEADHTLGTVDFAAGIKPHGVPMTGTNNVWITAHKTFAGAKEKITGCTAAVRFGGEAAGVAGGTRVFVTGNAAYPYHYWRSDIGLHLSAGMTYFPDLYEEVLDQNSEAITAAAKMGEQLILFKESSVFAVGYSFDGENVYYPVRECSNVIGCDMPHSVQLIDNRLVFAHSRSGVHMLVSADNALENIVKPLSANVNSLLLREKNLKSACSCDFGRYYWLCANGRTYLWDYDTTPYYNYADYDKAQRRLAWYRFDNIKAAVFTSLGENLCYGGADGLVIMTRSHTDFGQAITAYFKSKAFDLGSPDERKTFVALYPGFSADGNAQVTVYAGNEKTDSYAAKDFEPRSFDWRNLSWGAYTWNRIKYEQVFQMRLNMRRAGFLQVKVAGGRLDRGVGLSSLRITYFNNGKVKG